MDRETEQSCKTETKEGRNVQNKNTCWWV